MTLNHGSVQQGEAVPPTCVLAVMQGGARAVPVPFAGAAPRWLQGGSGLLDVAGLSKAALAQLQPEASFWQTGASRRVLASRHRVPAVL